MNCLYTLNTMVGGSRQCRYLDTINYASFVDACYRWGCNYAEINHFGQDLPSCHWGKLAGPSHLTGYKKLLYLDSDMLISDHAPNPFDLCDEGDTLYCVTDAQGPNPNPLWKELVLGGMAEVAAANDGFSVPDANCYFNAGFLMFCNTSSIREVFDLACKNSGFSLAPFFEQTVLNAVVHNRLKVKLLPETWNYVLWDRPKNESAYINHRCNRPY